jgi:hypothetical protein
LLNFAASSEPPVHEPHPAIRGSLGAAVLFSLKKGRLLMEIVFGEETTMQGSTLRTRAIVDGKEVDCKADMEVITELDDLATKAGIPMGKDIAAIANSLRPFFVRKIENGSFDDEDRTSVTLQVHELVSFMQRREDSEPSESA